MILFGNDAERFIAYPISNPDPKTGLSTINWIAETSVEPTTQVNQEDWNREVTKDRFATTFKDWDFKQMIEHLGCFLATLTIFGIW